MKSYDLILFDLDGTLTQSDPGIIRCVRDTLVKLGYPVPEQPVLRKFIGPPLTLSLEEYCGITGEDANRFVDEYRIIYNKDGVYEANVFDGIFPLLKKLREAGYRLAVATSKPQNAAELVIGHFGLLPCFDMVSGSSEDEKGSKLLVMQHAMEKIGAAPSRTLMIGDTRFDAEGAQQAGTDFLGALVRLRHPGGDGGLCSRLCLCFFPGGNGEMDSGRISAVGCSFLKKKV